MHESGDVIGEIFDAVGDFGRVAFAGAAQVDGDAREVLAVLGDLERIAGVVGCEERDQDEGVTCALLFVVLR